MFPRVSGTQRSVADLTINALFGEVRPVAHRIRHTPTEDSMNVATLNVGVPLVRLRQEPHFVASHLRARGWLLTVVLVRGLSPVSRLRVATNLHLTHVQIGQNWACNI